MNSSANLAFSNSVGVNVLNTNFTGARLRSCALKRDRVRWQASAASDEAQSRVDRSVGKGIDVSFGSLSPVVRAVVTTAAVAGTACTAWFVTPRKYAPVAAATSATAIAALGVTTLRKGPGKAARRALAKAVADGVDTKERVAAVQSAYGVSHADFEAMKQNMYEVYLQAMFDNKHVAYTEITELTNLKHALQLSGPAIGDAHFEAARAFYRDHVLFLDAEIGDPDRDASQAKLDKVIFLSDRMYADKDTEEAYAYEKARLCRFFSFTPEQYDERFSRVALPFYQDVVARAISDSSVSSEDLVAAQRALGVRDRQATVIRNDAYSDRVQQLVQEKGKLNASDTQMLTRLRELFVIEDDRAESTLKSLAEPVYREAIGSALDAVAKNDESYASIYGKLALRQTELSLPADTVRSSMTAEVTSRANDIVRRASKYLRVQNMNGCVKLVKELLAFTENVLSLVRVANDNSVDDVATLQQYMVGIGTNLSKTEPQQMYRLFLSECLSDRKIDDKEETELRRLRAIFNLSDVDAESAFKAAAGPVYRKLMVDALEGAKYDDETKASIEKARGDLSLPLQTSKGICVELYKNRLRKVTQGNRILQEHEAQELFVVRQFMNLSQEDTAEVHKDFMGPIYEQSVTEAMGPTGILLDDYKQGLERLRDRLFLTKEDADAVFYRVVKQRMRRYVDRALTQLEKRALFRGQNEERDVGEDPNIKRAGATLGIDAGGLPIELSSMVDFYVRNNLIVQEEVEVEGQKRTVSKYPITLRGEIPPKVYNELYKQYLIQCFSASSRGEKQRLFAALDQLGSILGMTEDEVASIHANIGSLIYKNYVTQALSKGPVEDKDVEFLNNIQRMLSMKEEQCQSIMKDAKESRVSVLLEQIFAQPKVLPESVKKMRETARLLEVDIVKDLSITEEQRGRLFGIEIDAAIDRGELTAENQGLIQEVQEGLQLGDEKAREIVLGCIQKRSLSHLVQAAASLRQERSETAVAELRTMLRYGKLLPAKVKAPAVSLSEKQELFLLFQAFVITDGAMTDQAREQIELLKMMFGFSDADLETIS